MGNKRISSGANMPKTIPRILIVDNEIEICNLFNDFFDFLGYDSFFEIDGDKVFEQLDTLEYDLLFIDLNLGNISGIEILKKSKLVHPLSEVIIVTGFGSDETVLKTLQYGAFSYVQKPISFTDIKIRTEEALARLRYNAMAENLREVITSHDEKLKKHLETIVNLDRLSTFLNLTIDIETLADSILVGIENIISGRFYSFFFVDEINKEMVISSRETLNRSEVTILEGQIKDAFERMANTKLVDSFNMRVSLSTEISESDVENIESTGEIESVFVPVFIDNSIRGVLGISGIDADMKDETEDLLYLISTRVAYVLTNATLHRDTKLLALTDGLTGLLNHRAFKDQLQLEFDRFIRYGSFLSLIVVDCDDLKDINDNYGHPAGDILLRKIGELIKETTRDSDVLARYGGDEFVILLPQSNSTNAVNLAERIRKKIQDYTFNIQSYQIKSTITLGTSTAPKEDIKTPLDLLELVKTELLLPGNDDVIYTAYFELRMLNEKNSGKQCFL